MAGVFAPSPYAFLRSCGLLGFSARAARLLVCQKTDRWLVDTVVGFLDLRSLRDAASACGKFAQAASPFISAVAKELGLIFFGVDVRLEFVKGGSSAPMLLRSFCLMLPAVSTTGPVSTSGALTWGGEVVLRAPSGITSSILCVEALVQSAMTLSRPEFMLFGESCRLRAVSSKIADDIRDGILEETLTPFAGIYKAIRLSAYSTGGYFRFVRQSEQTVPPEHLRRSVQPHLAAN